MRGLRTAWVGLWVCCGLLLGAATVRAQAPAGAATPTGEWELTTTIFGVPLGERLNLKVEKGTLSGSIRRRGKSIPVSGRVDGDAVRFEYTEADGTKHAYVGRIQDGALTGQATSTGGGSWGDTPPSDWTARRAATDRPAGPRTIDFEPTTFSRVFSASVPPVLRIWPGDTVRTKTVDAGGVDENKAARVLGGNPQTGPFYIEGAMPGDVVAVHIRKLRLNRGTAISDDGLVERATNNDYAAEHKDNDFNDVVWNLDLERGVGTLAKPSPRLKDLSVPLRPMLGCVGVAPGFGSTGIRTGDSGRFGGNMDYSEVREGATVYLPVAQPGALLYVGDGHAVQGDGELNGNALETSLDVEITVDLIREKSLGGPRVENADYLMAMGLGGSLDEAFRDATSDLATWVQEDYQLTGPETAILLGATIEYQISEVADRNVGVVAKLRKSRIPPAPAAGAKKP